jgi:hypothetical protein
MACRGTALLFFNNIHKTRQTEKMFNVSNIASEICVVEEERDRMAEGGLSFQL